LCSDGQTVWYFEYGTDRLFVKDDVFSNFSDRILPPMLQIANVANVADDAKVANVANVVNVADVANVVNVADDANVADDVNVVNDADDADDADDANVANVAFVAGVANVVNVANDANVADDAIVVNVASHVRTFGGAGLDAVHIKCAALTVVEGQLKAVLHFVVQCCKKAQGNPKGSNAVCAAPPVVKRRFILQKHQFCNLWGAV